MRTSIFGWARAIFAHQSCDVFVAQLRLVRADRTASAPTVHALKTKKLAVPPVAQRARAAAKALARIRTSATLAAANDGV
ncbi:hypothetical protein P4O66_006640 [Electrophorus voltai]|uniref:Uncharacterized protein n=1 Tax=Electrophorus voltai TaxID=2609070 RepID=A0AAD9DZ23_9TELE|nr:hypothetical protein P4O66_006640 [Electrophorus voltai]